MKIQFILLLIFFGATLASASIPLYEKEGESFTLNLYMDIYYTKSFNKVNDTINLIRFTGNSKFADEFRLNIISLLFHYNKDNIQAVFDLQFGDMPHLLANADQEFIKYIGKAYLAYTFDNQWGIQVGYLSDPIGIESSRPIDNMMTSVSIVGYYEPDNFIGAKLILPISNNFSSMIYFGNPFTLKNGKNKHLNYGVQFSYNLLQNLQLAYSAQYGNQADINVPIQNNLLYNSFSADYQMTENLHLITEFDYASQKGVFSNPDRTEAMNGGFVALQYQVVNSFYVKGRYEIFNDNSGFMTGNLIEHNGYLLGSAWNGVGMNLSGMAATLEYRPNPNIYVKGEYRLLQAKSGQHIFNNNTEESINYITLNTGIRF